MYYGDIRLGDTIDIKFTTRQVSGAPTTLAGTPVVSAYPGNSTTQLTAGITLSVDFDGVTGLHNVRVVATSGNGYATTTNYVLVITTGSVNSVSVVGEVIGSFSIEARSALMPATAGRTAVVDAAGLIDANAVKLGPTGAGTAQTARDVGASVLVAGDFSATMKTSIGTAVAASAVASVTGNVGGNVTGSVGSVATGGISNASFAAGAIDAAAIAASAIGASEIAADAITAAKIADGAIDAATFAAGAINAAAIGADAITAAKIADGAIDAATFAAGAINAAAIAADAITDAKVASDVTIASVTGSVGSVAGAVGSVTGNVGGNVTGSVGSVAAGGIAANSFANNAITAAALAADAVDEILDEAVGDGTLTMRQVLRICAATLAGKLAGAATTTITIRNAADTADVIVATVDASGNRSAVTVTP